MIRKVNAWILALALLPAAVFADVEMRGVVIKMDKAKNHLIVRTDRVEEMLLLGKDTKGIDNAKEGAKVIVKYSEKSGEPRAIEIIPQIDAPTQVAPR